MLVQVLMRGVIVITLQSLGLLRGAGEVKSCADLEHPDNAPALGWAGSLLVQGGQILNSVLTEASKPSQQILTGTEEQKLPPWGSWLLDSTRYGDLSLLLKHPGCSRSLLEEAQCFGMVLAGAVGALLRWFWSAWSRALGCCGHQWGCWDAQPETLRVP